MVSAPSVVVKECELLNKDVWVLPLVLHAIDGAHDTPHSCIHANIHRLPLRKPDSPDTPTMATQAIRGLRNPTTALEAEITRLNMRVV